MHLIDCFMDLIVYVASMMKPGRDVQPDFKTVKKDLDGLLNKSLELKEKENFSDRDYHYACLSVSVWIDEAILNSNWEHKRKWQSQSLQRRYYNMADGGIEFFNRLDKIGHEDRDVREVAYFCLTLGLTGRYVKKKDTAVLDHLKSSNLKRLFGSSVGDPTLENRRLFPEAYQKQTSTLSSKKHSYNLRMLSLVVGLFSIGVFFGLVTIYYYLLKMDLDKFV